MPGVARARSMVPLLQQTFENAMRVSSLASLGPGALGAVCEGIGDPSLSIRLLAGIESAMRGRRIVRRVRVEQVDPGEHRPRRLREPSARGRHHLGRAPLGELEVQARGA